MNENLNLSAAIINDHSSARLAIRELLENVDVSVIAEVGDGKEALRIINKSKPDVVIIDIDIPSISGVELVEMLRENKFNNSIIVTSARNDTFYAKRSADAGANGFISKQGGIANILFAIYAAQSGYSCFPFSLNEFIGTRTHEEKKLLSLSSQEEKVMRAILKGDDNMHIASEMHISNKTVSTYKKRFMKKLECNSLMDLFSFASRNKIN